MRLRGDFEFPTASFYSGNALDAFVSPRSLFFAAPEMKCVGENYVAKQIVLRTVADVERGIELEIACDVTGETDRR
jgi:hypothetical protein